MEKGTGVPERWIEPQTLVSAVCLQITNKGTAHASSSSPTLHTAGGQNPDLPTKPAAFTRGSQFPSRRSDSGFHMGKGSQEGGAVSCACTKAGS